MLLFYFQSLVFVQCSCEILMVRQVMSIKDVAAQSASWPASSSTMNQEKMWEFWKGGVNCQDRLSQCTSPHLPYTDPTQTRCQRSSTGKNNGWLNASCHQIANSLPNCLENHPGMMNQGIHIPLAHWNY